MSNSKIAAVAAYDAATASPTSADWRAIATALRACVPLPKARGAASAPGGWVHYPTGPKATFQTILVTFADGRAIRATAGTYPGKSVNVGQAVLAAVAFCRRRIYSAVGNIQPCEFSVTLVPWDAAIAVPPIASVILEETGEAFDVAACNAATVDARAGTFVLADAEREAVLLRESDRAALVEAFPDFSMWEVSRPAYALRALYVRAWRAAYYAKEVALREDTCARLAALDIVQAAERQAHWCEAVAPAYDAPDAWEVGGTVDAPEAVGGTGAAPEPAPAPPTPSSPKRSARKARSGGGSSGTPVVEIQAASPVVGIEAVRPVEAIADPVEAMEFEPVPSTFGDDEGLWSPDAETHPVVAHCHSQKARSALFARVLDGTFPADGAQGKAGSFRLTYADAVACEGLPSIRLTGMPRKTYTRRAAPLPAVRVTPRPALHIPAGAFTPASVGAGFPATLHAPAM